MKILFKLFSLKLLVSILGLISSIIVVRYFGLSRDVEIYFGAQSLVYVIISLTQAGQLSEIFLPEFIILNKRKKKLGFTALNIVINRMAIYSMIAFIIIFIFSELLIKIILPGFTENERLEASLMFKLLLPSLFFQITNSFFITTLDALKKYGRAEILGVINVIVNILCVVILYQYLYVWSLVVALFTGKIIEFIFYFYNLKKAGYNYQFIFSNPEFDHRKFFKSIRSTFIYAGSTQIYMIVLISLISYLPEGTLAIFKYVQNLSNKIKGLFFQPIFTVFFTKYSILLSNSKNLFNEFRIAKQSILNINCIIIIGCVLLGDEVINLIWGGDKFDDENVFLAYVFLLFNLFGIIFSSIGQVYRKMAVANGKANKLYSLWVFSQLSSSLFAYLLISNFGIRGLYFIIPINSFLMALVSFFVYKQTPQPLKFNFVNSFQFYSVFAITLAFLIKYFFTKLNNPEIEFINIALLGFCTLILSIFPLITLYNLNDTKKNIN
ncbi:MAG: putative peptidoglycan lipid II flippase [Flavobacteriaceae bacterium]|jgi:putative peptidoglycan lipid II flippase